MRIVISLGGSVIVPGKVDYNFLKNFKKVIEKIKNNKIVIVTGGGSTARKYIEVLRKEKINEKILCLIGIETTKLNAMLVSNFLKANILIPNSINQIKGLLNKKNIVVTGALGYHPNMTSDGTAADIAKEIKADYFINITNVKGLYNKNPKESKDAKFISRISFKDFNKILNKIKFKAGQNFVLDQSAARVISKYKIKTIIIKDIRNLIKIVNNEKFIGTVISS